MLLEDTQGNVFVPLKFFINVIEKNFKKKKMMIFQYILQ